MAVSYQEKLNEPRRPTMHTTHYAAKAIEDHMFDAARKGAPKRRVESKKSEKLEEKWATRATRPVVNPS